MAGPTLGDPAMEVDELVGDLAARHDPFEVAALMMRFRRVTGPRVAGAKTLGWTWSDRRLRAWLRLPSVALASVWCAAPPWPTAPRGARGRPAGRNGVAVDLVTKDD